MTSSHVLAVDAGNTKTIALVADSKGTVIGRAAAGPGDIYGADCEEDAVATVEGAIQDALGQAGLGSSEIAAAVFCLAGVDWPEDHELWTSVLARRLPRAKLGVYNDGFALLWCLNPAGIGTAITVGTGPAIASRAPGGDTAAMGFWCQHPLGAVGLGEKALRAVYLAELGMAPPTSLRSAFLQVFDSEDVEALLHQFTRRGAPGGWSRLASSGRIVTGCAADGDPVAAGLVSEQARLLVDYAQAVSLRVGIDLERGGAGGEPWPLAIGGGVIRSDLPFFSTELVREIDARLPGATAILVAADPVVGSLIGALRLLDESLADAAFARLVDPVNRAPEVSS